MGHDAELVEQEEGMISGPSTEKSKRLAGATEYQWRAVHVRRLIAFT
jgi:hypothetical protein